MRTHLIALTAVFSLATLSSAGELDREFNGGVKVSAPKPTTELATKAPSSMELDKESPTQAWRRGGWGGGYGWGRGWGFGVGWGGGYGWGRGWGVGVGYGWGRGWGVGGGWYQPSYGFYGSSYWPSYSSSYYYPSFGYSYYPTFGYASYGYGYRGCGCCW